MITQVLAPAQYKRLFYIRIFSLLIDTSPFSVNDSSIGNTQYIMLVPQVTHSQSNLGSVAHCQQQLFHVNAANGTAAEIHTYSMTAASRDRLHGWQGNAVQSMTLVFTYHEAYMLPIQNTLSANF